MLTPLPKMLYFLKVQQLPLRLKTNSNIINRLGHVHSDSFQSGKNYRKPIYYLIEFAFKYKKKFRFFLLILSDYQFGNHNFKWSDFLFCNRRISLALSSVELDYPFKYGFQYFPKIMCYITSLLFLIDPYYANLITIVMFLHNRRK